MKKILLLTLTIVNLISPSRLLGYEIQPHDARAKEIFYIDPAANSQPKKSWTFIVYMASDNNLFHFTKHNLDGMKKVGSNNNINILVQMDPIGITGKTKRLYIGQNKIYQVNTNHSSAFEKQDAGSAQTLIDCCTWAIQNYPADNYALVLWNHGSGILDNVGGKLVNASELFRYNPETGLLELDRSISFLSYVQAREHKRGVCFSDTYGTFLTNQKLEYALSEIIKMLPKKKFDVIGFDACLMAMTEIANLLKPYASFMAGSEEVELGTGWAYDLVLEPFTRKTLTPQEFAVQITNAFQSFYKGVTQDYTYSCIDLSQINMLEKALNTVCSDLIEALTYQEYDSVYRTLRSCRAKQVCTHFSEPSYIDLDHFMKNIFESIPLMTLSNGKAYIKENLKQSINALRGALRIAVVKSVTGTNVTNAKGLAIYFPSYSIDKTYYKTPFATETKWISFLQKAL